MKIREKRFTINYKGTTYKSKNIKSIDLQFFKVVF